MKKKTIILIMCVLLLLLLTSWSYGGPDPRYARLLAHPDQELLSPSHGDQFDDALLVIVIPNWNTLYLVVRTEKESSKKNPTLQSLPTQEVKPKTPCSLTRTK
ncbi:MAG: hypothetical protein WCE90_06800 [Candidatus Zixiibacteriota bacterium]